MLTSAGGAAMTTEEASVQQLAVGQVVQAASGALAGRIERLPDAVAGEISLTVTLDQRPPVKVRVHPVTPVAALLTMAARKFREP
jgi:hypothetical protein